MRRVTILLALAGLTLLPGCWFFGSGFYDDDDEYVASGRVDGYSRPVTFERVSGDLGGHRVELAEVSGSASSGWGTTLEVETQQGGTWALFRLDVGADLYEPGIQDGAVYRSTSESVELMGCTGPAPYDFDYDGYASDVTVEVYQGEDADTRRVEFLAVFDDRFGSQTVRGSVLLDLTPSSDPYYGSTSTSGTSSDVRWDDVSADLGDQGAYTMSSVSGSGYGDGYYSEVELETTEPGQWVLFRLSTYGQDVFSAEPGDVITDGELMGCTGDAPGNFDYDGYADDVRVQIYEGGSPGERVGHVTGTFSTVWGSQTFDATFHFQAR